MKNSKITLAIDTAVKLAIVSALIVAAATKQQYGYYTFIRWLVMIAFVYFAYKSYEQNQIGLLIYFVGVAIMFNPFQKFWFIKETWHMIDYAIATVTTMTIVYDWIVEKKSKKNILTSN